MVVEIYQDDDAGFIRWVAANPAGYVLNIQRGLGTGDARVHAAACRHIARAIDVSASGERRLTAVYIKVCSATATELDEWSSQRLGVAIRRCPSCHDVGLASPRAPADSPRGPEVDQPDRPASPYRVAVSADEVFMEGPRYLPFERLSPDQLEARTRLRRALAGLSGEPDQVLHAWYSGPRPPNSDVENLVLYNIDSSGANLTRACAFGVRFELDSQSPPVGTPCRYRYRLLPSTDPLSSWQVGPRLARFADVDLGVFGAEHRLAQTWKAIHNAPVKVEQPLTPVESPFGVFLDVAVPASTPRVTPELVKSLVDGVVCAFQTHLDESTVADVASRIANEIHETAEAVARSLDATDRAVLGARHRLVHRRGVGVQWSPSDHLCVAGQVLGHVGDRWRLSGTVHALTPLVSSSTEGSGILPRV